MSDQDEPTTSADGEKGGASWAEDDGSVLGYMCRVDFECELGAAIGGNVIYPSIEDVKHHRSCVSSCGIVEVEVRLRRIVEKGDLFGEEELEAQREAELIDEAERGTAENR